MLEQKHSADVFDSLPNENQPILNSSEGDDVFSQFPEEDTPLTQREPTENVGDLLGIQPKESPSPKIEKKRVPGNSTGRNYRDEAFLQDWQETQNLDPLPGNLLILEISSF